jgi:chromosome segregation ATPase
MKQKRDENGKFVKMYPSREEYEAKIKTLRAELEDREKSLEKVNNELKFWKQEFGELKRTNEKLQESVTSLEVVKYWFLKHCGFFLRKKYYRAVEKDEL